ncbi:hypothetical protein AWM75_03855 [Aerococcus urinaehominis]|uniref:Fluoroacetyl-CoA-specific thioesterase-like domain-containing protein n=1 Tax=Aerococcus urinaehominis TaxID=128944 RepID=A0A109RHV1_9LACT|nr:hotdog domain-containing protein [Aerococcus urinaehominis]AMB99190.1 hypothetical protein AWM75_03855 [Aerococcus urinaehominis]SDM32872.1 Predicted thioesterase [Aerococcus urinaehominis]
MSLTIEYKASSQDTAQAMGSGSLDVLASPALVAMMENCATQVINGRLAEGETTVGVAFSLQHLRASLIDEPVSVTAELLSSDDKSFQFCITAYVQDQLIAKADHTRAKVNINRFLSRLK